MRKRIARLTAKVMQNEKFEKFWILDEKSKKKLWVVFSFIM